MIPRVLEPEVMDSPEEATGYDAMDHAGVNRVFVDDLLQALTNDAARQKPCPPTRVLDVGTGTALIPIELCQRDAFGGTIVAVDLAEEMLKLARLNVDRAGHSARVRCESVDGKSLPYEPGEFDVVMSNSIVHHIPEPFEVLREMRRVVRPGGLIFVRDLLRPDSQAEVERLVTLHASEETPESQQLFRQSLHAALTVEEMAELAEDVGLPRGCVSQTSDRHWTLVARG
ncbi:MAG: class I SAM-dependent methyltransferase [Planctomycetaceae bacterium]|nr:class I SAM-dependent methyltransferase [Planctomycetaceae bacterium]